jgi:hypothetical protein
VGLGYITRVPYLNVSVWYQIIPWRICDEICVGEFLCNFLFPPLNVYSENQFFILNEVLDTWKVYRRYSLFSVIDEERYFMWKEVVREAIMTYLKLAFLADPLPPSCSWRTTVT